jgi:very-short-patch-repair endonuclease
VYAVGHCVWSREAAWIAAVLGVGDDAVLSHQSAGALWGLHPPYARIDVTVPRRVRPPAGVTTHRSVLPADEITGERDIPVTTVPRTLLDLAAVLDQRRVERAIEEAEARRLDDTLSLRDLVERYPGRRGTAIVRAILEAGQLGITYTRSDLEEAFLAFGRANSLPSPELNVAIEVRPGRWVEADCVWRSQRIVVELDSRRFHGTRWAFERDRAKDRALSVAGWTVIRVTWRQLHDDPDRLAADLRLLLRQAAA